MNIACVLEFTGIWIEKGMGLVVTGFIPTLLGEIFEYAPTTRELGVSIGIYAMGALVFTLLAKAGIAIELGYVRAAESPKIHVDEQDRPVPESPNSLPKPS